MLHKPHQIINGKMNSVRSAASEVGIVEYNSKYKLEIQLGILENNLVQVQIVMRRKGFSFQT